VPFMDLRRGASDMTDATDDEDVFCDDLTV
jgi:hypothetical protein